MASRPAVHSNKLILAEIEAALAEERGSSLAGSTLTEAHCWLVMLCCVVCAACELGRVRCRMCCAVARGLAHEVGGAYETGCGRQCLSTAGLDTDRFNLVVRPRRCAQSGGCGASHSFEGSSHSSDATRIHPMCTRERQEQAAASGFDLHTASRLCANAAWARWSYLVHHLATACVLTAALMLAGGRRRPKR